jgi:hypothetical protein
MERIRGVHTDFARKAWDHVLLHDCIGGGDAEVPHVGVAGAAMEARHSSDIMVEHATNVGMMLLRAAKDSALNELEQCDHSRVQGGRERH